MLWYMATRGYEVCETRMLTMWCRCSGYFFQDVSEVVGHKVGAYVRIHPLPVFPE